MTSKDSNIFTDPPEGLGEDEYYFGTFVVGIGGMDGIEVARAFAVAGNRLLEAAENQRESWEAAYPILFCYRHALELYLKAVLPKSERNHSLGNLLKALSPHLAGRYPEDQVAWLLGCIAEFDRVDPKSTLFRYHDGLSSSYRKGEKPDPELWVDFKNLRRSTAKMFQGLERIRLLQHRIP